MDMTAGFWLWLAVVVGLMLWWWNEYWYALPFLLRRRGKLPPGYMGLPFLGEMLAFLWYFKVLGRPDDFINAKRRKYGDGIGMYRTHLFGSPTIIVCTPSANKLVLQSESRFGIGWNAEELVGKTSLVAVEGAAHTRVRGLVLRAVNQPDALRKITLMVQPRVTAALKSWSHRGRITTLKEANKVTFANTGKYFASFETEHVLDTLDDLFKGIVNGLRAYPLNFPGTAHHHALQCRRKAVAIFREELEKRKRCEASSEAKNDLMEALMEMKDEEGNRLSEIEVLDNIVSLVIAGYTSTSLVIMWAFYYLPKYPQHMPISKKLNGNLITYEEISSCKYTSKVVEEIIRLANVAAFTFRSAKEDVEYRGYKIPKGWKVVCWLRYIHTNPEYFEDPMCFNPDRWNVRGTKAGIIFSVWRGAKNLRWKHVCSIASFHSTSSSGCRLQVINQYLENHSIQLINSVLINFRWKLVNPNVGMSYLPHPTPADGVEIDITHI
ncbi:hypothetical protein C2S53_009190 [Perilla frutescens var. hirtella]|uniref:Cytochrome P450 n=1 Tax=Perilla frutescens var. hirtella TaxID=608512 RepID=A0AAD4IQL8_PERFH|nr:hypothetical protein C2S53_009190 [Perilla frutescens var. hirtella]